MLQGAGGKNDDAAGETEVKLLLFCLGCDRAAADAPPVHHRDHRRQHQASQKAAAGLEGEGLQVVHSYRLRHECCAPDHGAQE